MMTFEDKPLVQHPLFTYFMDFEGSAVSAAQFPKIQAIIRHSRPRTRREFKIDKVKLTYERRDTNHQFLCIL